MNYPDEINLRPSCLMWVVIVMGGWVVLFGVIGLFVWLVQAISR